MLAPHASRWMEKNSVEQGDAEPAGRITTFAFSKRDANGSAYDKCLFAQIL
jgi:hypothetical protein